MPEIVGSLEATAVLAPVNLVYIVRSESSGFVTAELNVNVQVTITADPTLTGLSRSLLTVIEVKLGTKRKNMVKFNTLIFYVIVIKIKSACVQILFESHYSALKKLL